MLQRANFGPELFDRRTRQERYETLGDDLDDTPTQLDRAVTARGQIRTVLETFRDRLFTEIVPGRSTVPKTLIFCKDDAHAEEVVTTECEVFGKGNDFAAKITYAAKDPKGHLQAFRTFAFLCHRGDRGHNRHRHRRDAAGVRERTGRQGRPFSDARVMIEGIVDRYRCGIAWRDLPPVFGPWQTVWTWHRRMAGDGTWDKVLARLTAAADGARRRRDRLPGEVATNARRWGGVPRHRATHVSRDSSIKRYGYGAPGACRHRRRQHGADYRMVSRSSNGLEVAREVSCFRAAAAPALADAG